MKVAFLYNIFGLNRSTPIETPIGMINEDEKRFIKDADDLLSDPQVIRRIEVYLNIYRDHKIETVRTWRYIDDDWNSKLIRKIRSFNPQITSEDMTAEAVVTQTAYVRYKAEAFDALMKEKNLDKYIQKVEKALAANHKSYVLRDKRVAEQLKALAQDPANKRATIIIPRGVDHYTNLRSDVDQFKQKSANVKLEVRGDFEKSQPDPKLWFLDYLLNNTYHVNSIKNEILFAKSSGDNDREAFYKLYYAVLNRLKGEKIDQLFRDVQNHPFGSQVNPIVIAMYVLKYLEKSGLISEKELADLYYPFLYADEGSQVRIAFQLNNGEKKGVIFKKDNAQISSRSEEILPMSMDVAIQAVRLQVPISSSGVTFGVMAFNEKGEVLTKWKNDTHPSGHKTLLVGTSFDIPENQMSSDWLSLTVFYDENTKINRIEIMAPAFLNAQSSYTNAMIKFKDIMRANLPDDFDRRSKSSKYQEHLDMLRKDIVRAAQVLFKALGENTSVKDIVTMTNLGRSRLEHTVKVTLGELSELSHGGIDLDQAKMQMSVNKEGQGIKMQFDQAIVEKVKREGFDGIEFEIKSIVPVANLPVFLGIN
jgi:hypothetical protein